MLAADWAGPADGAEPCPADAGTSGAQPPWPDPGGTGLTQAGPDPTNQIRVGPLGPRRAVPPRVRPIRLNTRHGTATDLQPASPPRPAPTEATATERSKPTATATMGGLIRGRWRRRWPGWAPGAPRPT